MSKTSQNRSFAEDRVNRRLANEPQSNSSGNARLWDRTNRLAIFKASTDPRNSRKTGHSRICALSSRFTPSRSQWLDPMDQAALRIAKDWRLDCPNSCRDLPTIAVGAYGRCRSAVFALLSLDRHPSAFKPVARRKLGRSPNKLKLGISRPFKRNRTSILTIPVRGIPYGDP